MQTWLGYLFFTVIVVGGQIAAADAPFDVIIKGGTVYDGTGGEGHVADVAIRGDRIVGVGDFASAVTKKTIDARGLAVAPGFINMLSWSNESLIYPPAFYAKTEELIELCKVAAKYQGKYISHMRSEGNQLFQGLDEVIRISREAGIPAEVYHIKAAGQKNWPKEDELLERIEAAQKEGLKIRANMYTYTAAGTGLDACLPPWTEDGGYPALFKRLRDPATREKIKAEVQKPTDSWENLYLDAGGPEHILLAAFKSEKLKPLTGKTLAEVARMRGKDPIDTAMDLIAEDESRIGTIYSLMSEPNVKKELAKPWISFGSDEASQAPNGVFLKSNPHPRAYGNFARALGKYARDEKVLSMANAIHRLSGLPATNLGLDHRGFLKEGMFADVVVFDPAAITDHATFEKPHQYATGVKHVFVNGVQVIKDGEHTGAKPGRALWGPGKTK